MSGAKPAPIALPEQIRLDIKLPLGRIRQLHRVAEETRSDLINFQIGKVAGRLYTRLSGQRVLLVESKVQPPEKVDEVLWLRSDSPHQWLKPVPIGEQRVLPNLKGLPSTVLKSWKDQFFLKEEEQVEAETSNPGLRPPQIGALYAVLAHWKVTQEPANIVMPTGTGKTETMLAILAKERLPKLLVVVPTDALREQLARKFQSFGVLSDFGIIGPDALFPVVGILTRIPKSVAALEDMFSVCNVVVTTMAVAGRAQQFIQEALAHCASHLFIDEAHHIKAPTWDALKAHFKDKPVLQFTATPFRNDGKLVDGKPIFTYPLRKAQVEGYFRRITFQPVAEFLSDAADEAIAVKAVNQLRGDLDSGFDHLVMARAEEIRRAEEIYPIYQRLAPEYNPLLLHSELTQGERDAALGAITSRKSRVIVCVDMLGEGFDLPQLKIAAVHDLHKSLAVTLQFIGRFTRKLSSVGNATAIANIAAPEVEGRLRALYAEDSDWNQLLQVLSDSSTQREARRTEFLGQFVADTPVVPLQNIMPKMSTVIYRTDCLDWHLPRLEELAEAMEMYSSVAVNQAAKVALFVVRRIEPVDWGDVRELTDRVWHLYILYWDANRNVLFIHTSDKDSNLDNLAQAVAGDSATLIQGEEVFRAFAGLNRLMLMNLGLNHSLSRAVRFTMFVGDDIQVGLSQAQQEGKIKSNTFGRGFERGEKATVGCSHRGRIWSYRIASDVSEWVEWCNAVGTKVLDSSISFDKNILPYLIIPKQITSRPSHVPLMVEWSDELLKRNETFVTIEMAGTQVPFLNVGLEVVNMSDAGPLTFRVFTDEQSFEYETVFNADSVNYRPLQQDVKIHLGKKRSLMLSEFFQDEPPIFYFDSGGFLIYNRFCQVASANSSPYDANRIEAWDWSGVDIRVESQTEKKLRHSIQYRVIEKLCSPAWEQRYDFVIDDDSANEAADVVALAVQGEDLFIHLFHCKYSLDASAGGRVKDLYEVCGQAQRSARWRQDVERLLSNLLRRNSNRIAAGGPSRFEKGSPDVLLALQRRARFLRPNLAVFIVQPGLSKAQAKANQLQLLATTELHIKETSLGELRVIASP
jgi:superfamily II DNA or RNA helicase